MSSSGGSGLASSLTTTTCTVPLVPSSTLEMVYDAVRQAYGWPEDKTFALCGNATGQPLTLHDLHAGLDLVVYADDRRAPPHVGQPPAWLPVPAGPKPSLLSKNFNDLKPQVCSAHLRMMDEYGPVFKLSMPPKTEAVVICDAELAGQVRIVYDVLLTRRLPCRVSPPPFPL